MAYQASLTALNTNPSNVQNARQRQIRRPTKKSSSSSSRVMKYINNNNSNSNIYNSVLNMFNAQTTTSKQVKKWIFKIIFFILFVTQMVVFRTFFGSSSFSSSSTADTAISATTTTITDITMTQSWCDKIKTERSKLYKELHIAYPCEDDDYDKNNGNDTGNNQHYKSAIVCFLTAGVNGKGTRTVFTGQDYINGALALGASLTQHLTRKDTNRLLLVRDGFHLPEEEEKKLNAVGWTIGKSPRVDVDTKYVPNFARYKTTYTKLAAIGLSEYECVLLMDADTLAVGNIDDLLSCNVFDRPEYKVAGTLDYYRGNWYHFNTGSILWRASAEEMNRVYDLTKDDTFMKRFQSDQIFLNTVYPDRTDVQKNELMSEKGLESNKDDWGEVVNLPWGYNAQTHVEVQLPEFWDKHLSDVKIFHFTEKKGWQCPERYGSPPSNEEMPLAKDCNNKIPLCFCREAYRWYDSLKLASEMAERTTKA